MVSFCGGGLVLGTVRDCSAYKFFRLSPAQKPRRLRPLRANVCPPGHFSPENFGSCVCVSSRQWVTVATLTLLRARARHQKSRQPANPACPPQWGHCGKKKTNDLRHRRFDRSGFSFRTSQRFRSGADSDIRAPVDSPAPIAVPLQTAAGRHQVARAGPAPSPDSNAPAHGSA